MKQKPIIAFSPEQLDELRFILKEHFSQELEVELGDLQAEFLLEVINEKMGKFFYNKGVMDTIEAIKEKSDDLVLLLKE